jgi:subtilisin
VADVNEMSSRRKRYMVGRRAKESLPLGVDPMGVDELASLLQAAPDVDVLQQVGEAEDPIFVVLMEDTRAQLLNDQFREQLIVEQDRPLQLLPSGTTPAGARTLSDPTLRPLGEATAVQIRVQGDTAGEPPIANADVYLVGQFWPVRGKTDDQGEVTLELFGDTPDTLQSLIVKPRAGYWSRMIENPAVNPTEVNLVSVKSIATTLPNFPSQELYGWGQQAMKLDSVPADRQGSGVKIGVVDSGIYTDHEDLDAQIGHDFTDGSNDRTQTWRDDTIGHGSHCAGVIAGLLNGRGVRGFAPEAELQGYRIFDGGYTSWLIGSLQQCIDEGVDVVNLSLGSAEGSELLHQKIKQAKESGVACIAAAGNSGGQVLYPAAFPEVMAVSAIGKTGTFDIDSDHRRHVGANTTAEGYFNAQFSCFGDEIDVCAPGVAVLSTVPENGYAAWDGTSMACPHVTGLAALILAHRQDVPEMASRNSARVDKLFALIRQSADDLGLPREYQGSGVPNALRALDLEVVDGDEAEDPWAALAKFLEQALEIARAQVDA